MTDFNDSRELPFNKTLLAFVIAASLRFVISLDEIDHPRESMEGSDERGALPSSSKRRF